MTVPRSAVARMAPPSQPGTSTQTTVTSAGPPAAVDCVAEGDRVAGVGDDDLVGDVGVGEQRALLLERDDADGALGAGVLGGREAERAGLAGAADDGDDGARWSYVLLDDALGHGGRAADVHHGEAELAGQVVGDDRGDRAAEEDGVPVGGDLLALAVPALEAVLDDERGQGEGDEGGDAVADLRGRGATPGRPPRRCRRACRRSRSRGSASCRGRATISSTSRRTASPSSSVRCFRSSWRKDAASRLRRSTRMRTSSGHSSLRVSSRWAACGRTTASSRTRCNPVGSLARTGMSPPSTRRDDRTMSGWALDRPEILHLQWHSEH